MQLSEKQIGGGRGKGEGERGKGDIFQKMAPLSFCRRRRAHGCCVCVPQPIAICTLQCPPFVRSRPLRESEKIYQQKERAIFSRVCVSIVCDQNRI